MLKFYILLKKTTWCIFLILNQMIVCNVYAQNSLPNMTTDNGNKVNVINPRALTRRLYVT